MGNIVSKLNLNKTPRLVDSNSLIFAKNIKLLTDGTIGRDDGIKPLNLSFTQIQTVLNTAINELSGEIATVNGRMLVIEDDEHPIGVSVIDEDTAQPVTMYADAQTEHQYEQLTNRFGNLNQILNDIANYSISGIVPNNNEFFIFLTYTNNSSSAIFRYIEDTKTLSLVDVNWQWSGGTIKGYCERNLKGETILNISEYLDDSHKIPFKSINIDTCRYSYDESIYTQAPKVPFTNLSVSGYYYNKIKNGTYQFFVRYKVTDDIYTGWYPATSILQVGNQIKESSIFGTIRYRKKTLDSDNSFIFSVSHLNTALISSNNYSNFQLGFILTSDDGKTYGKIWKSFSFDTTTIYFDGNPVGLEDEDFSNFIKPIYNLYNVKNITSFKNKLYISNYIESNLNPDFQSYADSINVSLNYRDGIDKLYKYIIRYNNNDYKTNTIKLENSEFIIELKNGNVIKTVYDILSDLLNNDDIIYACEHADYNGIITEAIHSLGFKLTVVSETPTTYTDSSLQLKYKTSFYNSEDVVGSTLTNAFRLANTDDKVYLGIISKIGYIQYPYSQSFDIIYYTDTADGNGFKRYNLKGYFTLIGNIETTDFLNKQISTLIPLQSYKFYIHYVNENGEETNGYFIDEKKVDITTSNIKAIENHKIIYPVFTNITYPSGYPYAYISIVHSKKTVAECIDLRVKIDPFYPEDTTKYTTNIYSPDVNSRLISALQNINVTVVKGNGTSGLTTESYKGHYVSSNDGYDVKHIGDSGIIIINEDVTNVPNGWTKKIILPFIEQDYEINDALESLHKCTPYFNGDSYGSNSEDCYDMFLTGFISRVYLPNRSKGVDAQSTVRLYDKYFISGNDDYKKEYVSGTPNRVNLVDDGLSLVNFGSIFYDDDYEYEYLIYSNYNLGLFDLGTDINIQIKTKTVENQSRKFYFKSINSVSLSDLYQLSVDYIDYIERKYSIYNEDNIVKFDNTIRSSNILGDENSQERYSFEAEDYYNVPTNKGIITNLTAIGNFILVHTKDSLFNFSGNNSLTAQDGEVKPVETEVFDTGIQEVFGSGFGFAGLSKDTHAIVIQDGYIFYDASVKRIYIYGGQGSIECISDGIDKLLKYCNIQDVFLANDFCNNNRFFVCVKYLISAPDTYGYVTLSYNTRAKSFISIHDFKFEKAFNTKRNCYFVKDNAINIIDKDTIGYGDVTYGVDKLYPTYNFGTLFQNRVKASIIDIIVNDNIENVKTLDFVEWTISKILQFIPSTFIDGGNPNEKDLMAEESLDRTYSGDKMLIYTDTDYTSIMDINQSANDYSIYNPNSYKYPRYNQGRWTLNYFRDIKNANGSNNSDMKSLIEGRYFVIRFILNPTNNFKLETLRLMYNNKL